MRFAFRAEDKPPEPVSSQDNGSRCFKPGWQSFRRHNTATTTIYNNDKKIDGLLYNFKYAAEGSKLNIFSRFRQSYIVHCMMSNMLSTCDGLLLTPVAICACVPLAPNGFAQGLFGEALD